MGGECNKVMCVWGGGGLAVNAHMCPNPTPGLDLHRTASAQIGSTAPPFAALAPQMLWLCT